MILKKFDLLIFLNNPKGIEYDINSLVRAPNRKTDHCKMRQK